MYKGIEDSSNGCGLAACKHGFLVGCRSMIYVDACFLKGRFVGQLDATDDIYPIAFVV
jgi:hypothetical protein